MRNFCFKSASASLDFKNLKHKIMRKKRERMNF